MRFFKRKGNYVRIDNSDLSNKIDVIKSEFIKKKHHKHQTREHLVRVLMIKNMGRYFVYEKDYICNFANIIYWSSYGWCF